MPSLRAPTFPSSSRHLSPASFVVEAGQAIDTDEAPTVANRVSETSFSSAVVPELGLLRSSGGLPTKFFSLSMCTFFGRDFADRWISTVSGDSIRVTKYRPSYRFLHWSSSSTLPYTTSTGARTSFPKTSWESSIHNFVDHFQSIPLKAELLRHITLLRQLFL